jgi:hypothetical protein
VLAADRTIPDLLQLIQSEYREIPGLNLTKPQIQRFWGLAPDRCDALLDALVDARVLRRTRTDGYVRADAGW